MKRLALATLAFSGLLGACTGNALEIPEEGKIAAKVADLAFVGPTPDMALTSPAPDLATPPTPSFCPGDDALQNIPLTLSQFTPGEDTTTVAMTNGALVIGSMMAGDYGPYGLLGVDSAATTVDPSLRVRGVRVCYLLSNARSHLRQLRITHPLGGSPPAWQVDEDDVAHLDETGSYCTDPTYYEEVENQACLAVEGSAGPFSVLLAISFGDPSDTITIQSVDLVVSPPS